MSNIRDYVPVVYTESVFGVGHFGVLDRRTGEVAKVGTDDAAARQYADGLEYGSQAKGNFIWARPSDVVVKGELGPKPELMHFTPRTWGCASGQLGEGDSITVAQVVGSQRRAYIECKMSDHETTIVIDQDDAVDVANALLEAAGLDVRVEQ